MILLILLMFTALVVLALTLAGYIIQQSIYRGWNNWLVRWFKATNYQGYQKIVEEMRLKKERERVKNL